MYHSLLIIPTHHSARVKHHIIPRSPFCPYGAYLVPDSAWRLFLACPESKQKKKRKKKKTGHATYTFWKIYLNAPKCSKVLKLPEFDYTETELVSLESALSNSTWTSSTIKPEELQCTRRNPRTHTHTHTYNIYPQSLICSILNDKPLKTTSLYIQGWGTSASPLTHTFYSTACISYAWGIEC